MVQIHPLTLNDAEPLLQFELQNRAYFEHWINARDADYYSIDAVKAAIETAQREKREDKAYQFLVKQDEEIVGRINLTGVERRYYNKAMLGYRIGEQFAGRGYASQAVELALQTARADLKLWRVEATVRHENRASSRVLERNGFVAYGRATRSIRMHGVWYDLVHFERHLGDATVEASTAQANCVKWNARWVN
ncbi:GNAT family N-acetyltransferase [Paraburkholderia bryophila]|uniref:GNAT family N-acetyltransferase n=1 Tax=Burkholderiaceae TaxID=119060 RepID=UPI00068D21C6|nr:MULTISPECIES: GNAT family N-acetyltransferase [Burkholderiaceae]